MYVFFVPSFFQVVSIGYHGNVVHVWERFAHHWVRTENTNQVVYLRQGGLVQSRPPWLRRRLTRAACCLQAVYLTQATSGSWLDLQAWAGQIASFASCSMRPSFGTRRTRLPGMQKLYDISDSFFCAMHIGAFQLNSSFEKSHFGTQHVKKNPQKRKL